MRGEKEETIIMEDIISSKHENPVPIDKRAQTIWLDADGDGDVDVHDALFLAEWLWNSVELLFNITVFVVPVGALFGSALSLAGGSTVATSFARLADQMEPWADEFPGDFNGFLEAKAYAELALAVVVVVDALTVLHGLAVGIRRADRKVREFGEEGAFGCCDKSKVRPAAAAVPGAQSWTCRLVCCSLFIVRWFASHIFQATWAIGGTIVIWVSIIISYVLSVISTFLFASFFVAHSYCDNIASVLDLGIDFANSTLQRAAEAIELVETASATGHAAETSIYGADDGGGDDSCGGSFLGTVCSTAQARKSATAALIYETSPFPQLLAFIDTQLPVACNTVDLGKRLILRAGDFGDFADEFEDVTGPVPGLMQQAVLGTWLVLVGQILVLLYHQKYFTMWYYEGSMSRRHAKEKRLAAEK